MNDKTRGDDAADHAPRPDQTKRDEKPAAGKQDAPNYDKTTDGGRAIEDGDVNSANDE